MTSQLIIRKQTLASAVTLWLRCTLLCGLILPLNALKLPARTILPSSPEEHSTTIQARHQPLETAPPHPALVKRQLADSTIPGYNILGCFTDGDERVLRGDLHDEILHDLSPEYCHEECASKGYRVFGLEYGRQCICGWTMYPSVIESSSAPRADCGIPCPAAPGLDCGGAWRILVYSQTDRDLRSSTTVQPILTTTASSAVADPPSSSLASSTLKSSTTSAATTPASTSESTSQTSTAASSTSSSSSRTRTSSKKKEAKSTDSTTTFVQSTASTTPSSTSSTPTSDQQSSVPWQPTPLPVKEIVAGSAAAFVCSVGFLLLFLWRRSKAKSSTSSSPASTAPCSPSSPAWTGMTTPPEPGLAASKPGSATPYTAWRLRGNRDALGIKNIRESQLRSPPRPPSAVAEMPPPPSPPAPRQVHELGYEPKVHELRGEARWHWDQYLRESRILGAFATPRSTPRSTPRTNH